MRKLLLISILFVSTAHAQRRIGLVFYFKPEQSLIDSTKARIFQEFGIKKVRVLKVEEQESVASVDIENWSSYDAKCLIDQLEGYRTKKYRKIIGFTKKSLFVKDSMTKLVYGYSYPGAAIASNFLIYDRDRDGEWINVIIHEIGHIYGMNHCEDETCVMIAYNHLENREFCPNCKKILKEKRKRK